MNCERKSKEGSENNFYGLYFLNKLSFFLVSMDLKHFLFSFFKFSFSFNLNSNYFNKKELKRI